MKENKKIKGSYLTRSSCRFCEGKNLKSIIDFGLVPLAGGFLRKEDVPQEKYYPLDLSFCTDCFLVQVSNVVPANVLFSNYFYFSSSIGTLITHCKEFANETKKRFLADKKSPVVFEIGCNDGVMLKPLSELGIRAVGVDPATNVVRSIKNPQFTVVNAFFDQSVAKSIRDEHGMFDAILSSYSFAHIDDMISVIKGVKTLLKEDGVFIFEVYYLGTLIDEMQYDMIYHEHMSYYSLAALELFLKRFGMRIFDIKFTPGIRSGAVRFYAQNIGKKIEPETQALQDLRAYEKKRGFDRLNVFMDYAARVNETRVSLLALLDQLKAEKRTIIGYGASGRGTTIMNYCGIDGRYLDYVVDDAPAKHGFLTPGTHVPIQPWEFTKSAAVFPEYSLLFAWSFIDEVKKRRTDYLSAGGKFIVPLPEVAVVGG